MALPFVRSVASRYEVSVVCAEPSVEIFRCAEPSINIIAWTPPWYGETRKYGMSSLRRARLLELIGRLRSVRADVCVSGWADARVSALMMASGAKRRVGFPMTAQNYYATHLAWRARQLRVGKLIERVLGLCSLRAPLTEPLHRRSYDQHHMDDLSQLGESLGVKVSEEVPWLPSVALGERESLWVAERRRTGKKIWLMHPGGRLATKRWETSRFQALADGVFKRDDVALVVVAAPGEEEVTPSGDQFLVRPRNLRELMAWCAEADGVVCNDSLMAHLASAYGKPAMTIFGSGSSAWFRPRNSRSVVVESSTCGYRPCLDKCLMPGPVCLDSISVSVVEKALVAAFQRNAQN